MFSMSMTIGPCGRIVSEFVIGIKCQALRPLASDPSVYFAGSLSIMTFGSVLQFPADRAVTAGDHFVALLDPALDLHRSVVGDSSGHLDHLRFASVFHEDDFRDPFAIEFLRRFLLPIVRDLGVVVALVTRGHLLFALLDFFRTQLPSPVRMVTLCIGTATTSLTMFVSMSAVQLKLGRSDTSLSSIRIFTSKFVTSSCVPVPRRFSCVRNLLDRAFEFAIGISIDGDDSLLADLHV